VACTLQVAWDDQLTAYDFGARHPMTPVRVELTIELARAFDLFAQPEVSVERPANPPLTCNFRWCTCSST